MIFLSKRTLSAVLLILLAGCLVYANSFQVPFVLDDQLWIAGNDIIRSLANFFGNRQGYDLNPPRFVGILTFALNYSCGGLDVFGYHLVNLLVHLGNGLLVYALLGLTFRTPYFLRGKSGSEFREQVQVKPGANGKAQPESSTQSEPDFISVFKSTAFLVPFFAALLFVVHPLQTQAVTYLSQRMTSLATFFYLLSVVLYAKARLGMEQNPDCGFANSAEKRPPCKRIPRGATPAPASTRCSRLPVYICFTGSILAAILGMTTKEMAITLPLAIVLYEASFFRGPWRRRFACLLPLLATLPVVPLHVLTFSHPGSDLLSSVGDQFRAQSNLSRLDYLFTQFRVIVTYLRLLVLPVDQNLDYDYPIYRTLLHPAGLPVVPAPRPPSSPWLFTSSGAVGRSG